MEAITRLAIQKHNRLVLAERRLQKLSVELGKMASGIPNEDMEEYVKITEKTVKFYNPTED
jgi:hypothetical protein